MHPVLYISNRPKIIDWLAHELEDSSTEEASVWLHYHRYNTPKRIGNSRVLLMNPCHTPRCVALLVSEILLLSKTAKFSLQTMDYIVHGGKKFN